MPLAPATQLGPYQVIALIGRGGMGEVYSARDTRLDRDVALKTISDAVAHDASARTRFEREAKAVAALSHPNIVAIYDFSKQGDLWFTVTELLEGQTLRDRMSKGKLDPEEVNDVARQVAAGLAAAHDRGIVHRDLKPENIFLTDGGTIKILDFGLAVMKKAAVESEATDVMATRAGEIVGTVAYMAPEQLRGGAVTPAADVFALGAVLYECVTGHRPFSGNSSVETIAAILTAPPAPIHRSTALAPLIMRCLEKAPAARFASGRELRDALAAPQRPVSQEQATRVIVLPFRMLRRDEDLDFLSYSLPDAIVGSLAGIRSIVVRSSLAASHYTDREFDLARIAAEQDVNAVVTGSILASSGRLRVSAQLIEMPGAIVKWSHATETSLDDIFGVQDELVRKIVRSISGQVTESDSRALRKDVPRSALAYEFFLRANQQAHVPDGWVVARDLYRRAVEEDPEFAPAWARLGRVAWVMAKYTDDPHDNRGEAERALRRAVELNPDLPLAQRYYAEIEIEREQTLDSLRRLLDLVQLRPNDADLGAALGKALRYTGLLQESLDAFRRVQELDRQMPVSLAHTWFMLGDYGKAYASTNKDIFYMAPLTLAMLGRIDEANAMLTETLKRNPDRQFRAYHEALLWTLAGDHDAALRAIDIIANHNNDPEALYYMARSYARIGEHEKALALLERVVRSFFPATAYQHDPWLDPLRASKRFEAVVVEALRRNDEARSVFARWRGTLGSL